PPAGAVRRRRGDHGVGGGGALRVAADGLRAARGGRDRRDRRHRARRGRRVRQGPPAAEGAPQGAAGAGRKVLAGMNRVPFDTVPDTMGRKYQIISGDGHVETPPDGWLEYVPEQYRDRAPRLIRLPNGADGWLVEGQ